MLRALMVDFLDDELTDPDARIVEGIEAATKAESIEALAAILIKTGWGLQPGDPPIEAWPAFRAIVPVLKAYFQRP